MLLPLRDALALLEGEAPLVREAVGLADTVVLAERVVLGVAAAVAAPVEEREGVALLETAKLLDGALTVAVALRGEGGVALLLWD